MGLLRTLGVEYIPKLAADFLKAHPHQELQFTFLYRSYRTAFGGIGDRKV